MAGLRWWLFGDDPDPGEPDQRDPDPGTPPEREPGQPPGVDDPRPPRPQKHVRAVRRRVIPPGVIARHPEALSRCRECRQLYWPGSHLVRLRQRLAEVGVPI